MSTMYSNDAVCPQKANKTVCEPQEQLLGRISRFRGVPLTDPVAFYYCYIFIFYRVYSQGSKATLLVHLSCSGQQIRTLIKSLQTCIFKPVVFTSVCPWQLWLDRPQLRKLEASNSCSVLRLVK